MDATVGRKKKVHAGPGMESNPTSALYLPPLLPLVLSCCSPIGQWNYEPPLSSPYQTNIITIVGIIGIIITSLGVGKEKEKMKKMRGIF